MREEFYETSCAPHHAKAQKNFYVIYNVLFVVSCILLAISLYLLLLFPKDTGFIMLSVLFLASAVVFFLIKRRLMCCYDYTFVSGEVRIIKVVNGKTRKKFLIFDCKNVYKLGKVGSQTFQQLYDSKTCKLRVATPNGLGSENQLYYIAFNQNDADILAVLECDEKFLAFVASAAGRNAIEKDYK